MNDIRASGVFTVLMKTIRLIGLLTVAQGDGEMI